MAKGLFLTDMTVICPKCGGAGTVHFVQEQGIALFQCSSCYAKKETVSCGTDDVEVNGQCTSMGRYFRTAVPRDKVHGQKVRVKCPFCGELVVGDAAGNEASRQIIFQDVRGARDPYFHYPLYFQTQYRGKVIWALNREHLQALIAYLSANLRADLPEMRVRFGVLPTFMKTAKNRDGIVKLLKRLQEKL